MKTFGPTYAWATASINHAFVAGSILLYLFDLDLSAHDAADGVVESPSTAQIDAPPVYSCLIPSQRPKLSLISS